MTQKIIGLCRQIEAGYAADKSGLDDDMITLLVELGDHAGEIVAALERLAKLEVWHEEATR